MIFEIPSLVWWTPAQAAARIGVTVGTLANWRLKGIGPAYSKLSQNGRVRYRPEDVTTYCNTRLRIVPSVEISVEEAIRRVS